MTTGQEVSKCHSYARPADYPRISLVEILCFSPFHLHPMLLLMYLPILQRMERQKVYFSVSLAAGFLDAKQILPIRFTCLAFQGRSEMQAISLHFQLFSPSKQGLRGARLFFTGGPVSIPQLPECWEAIETEILARVCFSAQQSSLCWTRDSWGRNSSFLISSS